MQVLDAISPMERIQLTGQLQTELGSLEGSAPIQRVQIAGRIAALLRKLGDGAAEGAAITLTGQEFGEFPDTKEGVADLRESAYQHYLTQLIPLGGIFCQALGVEVEFNKKGLKKFESLSADPRKIKMVAALPELIATGRKTAEMDPSDKARQSGIKKAFVLKAGVNIGGEQVTARIIVHQRDDGTFNYDHSVDREEAVKATGGIRGALDSVVSTENGRSVLQPNEASLGRGLHHQDLILDQIENTGNVLDEAGDSEVLNLFIDGEADEQALPEPGHQIVEHLTGRGNLLRGIVRTDLTYAAAKAIDEYTFRKDGGFFIREKHLEGMGLATPTDPAVTVDPERQAELEAERAQLKAQAEADRLANDLARQQQKITQQVAKLRDVAASTLERAEAELGRDRLANTHRRASMAASGIAAAEGNRAIALTMNNLADAIERGQAKHLASITTRADVLTLAESLRSSRYLYERAKGMDYRTTEQRKHDPITADEARYAQFPTPTWGTAGANKARTLELLKGKRGGPAIANSIRYASVITTADAKALRDLLGTKEANSELGWWNVEQLAKAERLRRAGIENNEQLRDALVEFMEFKEGARAEDPIAKAERAIIGQKVGIDFFPTPKALAARMAALANIQKGDRVLEPSAGNGNLADAAKAAGADVDVIEISSQLRDILEAKGFTVVAHDFDSFTPEQAYDAILMNPPFSNRQDAAHIMRAFDMVKPGGHLVAIAGEGVFFGSDAKAVAFRNWLDLHGAEVETLEGGTFKDKDLLATTGANARLIILSR